MSDLVGRHRVRVVVDGADNSPLEVGVLQLDRTPPVASSIVLGTQSNVAEADWIASDALSGTDPAAPVIAEVNASPAADAAGAWLPFGDQPSPGDGRKVARTSLAGLPDGSHLVRAHLRDRAGNEAVSTLGTVVSDGTAPSVTGVSVVTAPGRTRTAELAFRVDDGGGVGVAAGRPRVALAGRPDSADLAVPGERGAGRVLVRFPGPGTYAVTIRVVDRAGNRGESAPVTIRVPGGVRAADLLTGPLPSIRAGTGSAPSADVAWAYRQAKAFHARRGVRLAARLRVARTRAGWRALLGGPTADRYAGYADLRGTVLLGPAATAGLASLRGAHGGRVRLSRADADAAVMGLAVLLHETFHATGPTARSDTLGTRSGLAFEEGFTEAATDDLLWVFVTGLDLPPQVRARLAVAVNRRRHAYGPEVRFARRMSALATDAGATSAKARAWRITVADTWGADRWRRLAVATGKKEATLRAQAAARTTRGALR